MGRKKRKPICLTWWDIIIPANLHPFPNTPLMIMTCGIAWSISPTASLPSWTSMCSPTLGQKSSKNPNYLEPNNWGPITFAVVNFDVHSLIFSGVNFSPVCACFEQEPPQRKLNCSSKGKEPHFCGQIIVKAWKMASLTKPHKANFLLTIWTLNSIKT